MEFAGDLSGRVFLVGVIHRAEALCFVLSGLQPGREVHDLEFGFVAATSPGGRNSGLPKKAAVSFGLAAKRFG